MASTKASEASTGKPRVAKNHPDGINRPSISSATRFLDSIDKITGLVVSTYSRDVLADIDTSPEHYFDSGWRATLASQLNEINVSDDVKLAWALVNTKFSNKGLIDDRNDKVVRLLDEEYCAVYLTLPSSRALSKSCLRYRVVRITRNTSRTCLSTCYGNSFSIPQ